MNRFFSKLDLRDIKIDPQGSRFSPDDPDTMLDDPAVESDEQVPEAQVAVNGRRPVDAYAPAWTNVAADGAIDTQNSVLDGGVDGGASVAVASAPSPEVASQDGVARHGEVLKVSARSRPSAVAGAIAGVVRENGRAEVQAIGAGATNQAVKAVAIARDYLRETGIEAICLPAFIDVTIDDEERTAIRLVVEPR